MQKNNIQEKITLHLKEAAISLFAKEQEGYAVSLVNDLRLELPKAMQHGDLVSNAAMRLAKPLGRAPMQIAEAIKEACIKRLTDAGEGWLIDKIDIIKPGFINFWLSGKYLKGLLAQVMSKGDSYGSWQHDKTEKLMIEFVSANPTGPLTVAHGRQAAIGDALGNILKFYGLDVTKEYFINDDGRQIKVLGESIMHHYLGLYGVESPFPEDGYQGGYVKDIAVQIKAEYGDKFVNDRDKNRQFFSDYGVNVIMNIIRKDLDAFDVRFDTWFSQKTLTREVVDAALNELKGKGYVFESEGAVWFKATAFGDEKDRVVVKSDGLYTYFAPDIAYHRIKFERGFDRLINIWGPDHHGYIPRLKAAVQALGHDRSAIDVLIVQLATLYRNGEVLSMSTRKGEFITLEEVRKEVGKDVTRFFFLMRKLDSHLDFDLEVAKKQSSDNPVYYIQYAHARIWSIIEFSTANSGELDGANEDFSLLSQPEETEIMRIISQFPVYVRDSAVSLEPYYIILYLNTLAAAFHNFYAKHKVITDNVALSKTRLYLVNCVRICLANGLRLLGVSLPKKM